MIQPEENPKDAEVKICLSYTLSQKIIIQRFRLTLMTSPLPIKNVKTSQVIRIL